MTVRLQHYLCLPFFPLALATATPSHANPTVIPESASLAKTVEIADVHMHLVGQSVEFHKRQMDRNNVRWGGGVGPTGSGRPKPSEMTQECRRGNATHYRLHRSPKGPHSLPDRSMRR